MIPPTTLVRDSAEQGAATVLSVPLHGAPPGPRLHIAALDGIRGIASLYVMLGHIYLIYTVETVAVEPTQYAFGHIFRYGKMAVAFFIVLSGYCLMAPVCSSDTLQLKGGTFPYLLRRARRILPPYYAAMAIVLLGIWLIPALAYPGTKFWGLALPAFPPAVLLSHLFMVYNLNADWVFRIDPPFWSVATEWQIYFLFPLILLPVLRRAGWLPTLLTAFAVGIVPHLIGQHRGWFTPAHPWYVGLFAFGMLAAMATTTRSPAGPPKWLRDYAGFILLAGLALLVSWQLSTDWFDKKSLPCDLTYGIIATASLTFLTRGGPLHSASAYVASTVRSLLEWWPLKRLGDISYSLYLIHAPVLVLTHRLTQPWHTSPQRVLLIMFGIGAPASLLAAALFHLAFERPFMAAKRKTPHPIPLATTAPSLPLAAEVQ
jgi:peptidoglycan/LPS O-acetylase OafA/YrhL